MVVRKEIRGLQAKVIHKSHTIYKQPNDMAGSCTFLTGDIEDLRKKCSKFIKMLGFLLFPPPLENTCSISSIEYNCFCIKLSQSCFSGIP